MPYNKNAIVTESCYPAGEQRETRSKLNRMRFSSKRRGGLLRHEWGTWQELHRVVLRILPVSKDYKRAGGQGWIMKFTAGYREDFPITRLPNAVTAVIIRKKFPEWQHLSLWWLSTLLLRPSFTNIKIVVALFFYYDQLRRLSFFLSDYEFWFYAVVVSQSRRALEFARAEVSNPSSMVFSRRLNKWVAGVSMFCGGELLSKEYAGISDV